MVNDVNNVMVCLLERLQVTVSYSIKLNHTRKELRVLLFLKMQVL